MQTLMGIKWLFLELTFESHQPENEESLCPPQEQEKRKDTTSKQVRGEICETNLMHPTGSSIEATWPT